MKSDNLRRLGALGRLKVQAALHEWDPIGVYEQDDGTWPDHEYEACVRPVVALLDAGASEEKIVEYLRRVCVDQIEISFDQRRAQEIVAGLIVFWAGWKARVKELGADYIEDGAA